MADYEARKATIKKAAEQVAKGGVWLRPAHPDWVKEERERRANA